MNFNRRTHREDLLFVIALLVPAIFAGARYFDSDTQMMQIVQAQQKTAEVALDTQAQPAAVKQAARKAGEAI
jgi:hypothetical protein